MPLDNNVTLTFASSFGRCPSCRKQNLSARLKAGGCEDLSIQQKLGNLNTAIILDKITGASSSLIHIFNVQSHFIT